MGFFKNRVEIKNGTKVTLSEMNLKKLDRTYETDLFDRNDKKVFTTFHRESRKCFQTQVRDYAFEQILDRHLYTFRHILVIPDPYGMAPQTALLLFNSSEMRKVRYVVHGEREADDFCGEGILTKRHRVPIFGLYQGRNNKLDLWLLDEAGDVIKHRMLNIFVPDFTLSFEGMIKAEKRDMGYFPFVLIDGASHRPVSIDSSGKIRYWLRLDDTNVGIKPLSNGRFLVVDSMANRMDKSGAILPGRYHEMDYMGRVYRSFLVEYKIGDAIADSCDSLFLVIDSDDKHMNDRIAELDMNSGEIVSYCDLHDLFGDKYYSKGDWTGIYHMEFHEGMLLISVKRLHTVLLLDWNTKKIKWVICPEKIWGDTDVSKYRLKVSGYKECICSQPGSVTLASGSLSGKAGLVMFDTGVEGKISTGEKPPKTSAVRNIITDAEEMSMSVVSSIKIDKCSAFSGVLLTDNDRYILAAEGKLREREPSRRAHLNMIDFDGGKSCFGIDLARVFTKAWIFKPDLEDYCAPVPLNEKVLFGSLHDPQVFDGEFKEVVNDGIDKNYFNKVVVCDDLFLFYMVPGSVKRIYFKGENCTYVQDYTNIKEGDKKTRFVITMKNFVQDEYNVYVELKNGIYKLKSEIRVL